jgi:hypothetical protein
VLVILKLSEYAECAIDGGCGFEFKAPLCSVTSLTEAAGDHDLNQFGNVFTITGSGFNTETTFFTDSFEASIIEIESDGSSI